MERDNELTAKDDGTALANACDSGRKRELMAESCTLVDYAGGISSDCSFYLLVAAFLSLSTLRNTYLPQTYKGMESDVYIGSLEQARDTLLHLIGDYRR